MESNAFMMHNGMVIPHPGFGTCKIPEEHVCETVLRAIQVGYRHFDTASMYGNEIQVGEALRRSALPREDLFVTSKVWNTDRGYSSTKAAFESSLERLGLTYLDLYLIHWPANRKQFGSDAENINAQTWRALEDLYAEGRVRSIGVSNFLPHHLEALAKTARIFPMVNQIECHPGWLQLPAVEYCHAHGIVVEAWSPLGRRAVLNHPVLRKIAEKSGMTAAQVCLAWLFGHGVLPLPKSVEAAHMEQNFHVCAMLNEDQMKAIDELSPMGKCSDPDTVDF